jgi:beta-N-acetylhexosaminidase
MPNAKSQQPKELFMNVEQMLADMTVEEKVGQLFMLAFASNRLDEARVLMEDHLVGSSYISNDNVPTPAAAIDLTNTLQGFAANTRLKIPLLLGVDQEGTWSVMTPGSSPGPGNLALGATARPDDAYAMYSVLAKELAAVGLKAVFAPCADCNSNPVNSIIGMRSFGEKPGLVGAMTAAAVRGTQENGVVATVKHFPGHGDTRIDTHRGLATVDRSPDELRAIDLAPFADGINAGVAMVMTSHIFFTALDPDRPATISPVILQDVLRDELGFEGVVVTDSMNMKSMKRNFDPQESVARALKAGVDVIMLAEEHYDHDAATYLEQQRGLIQAVIDAISSGDLSTERVDDAARRVLTLKAQFDLSIEPITDTESVLAQIGNAANRQVELDVARHAVAVLRNDGDLIPLGGSQPILLVNTTTRSSYDILGNTRGIGPNQTTPAFEFFADALREKRQIMQTIAAEDMLNGADLDIPDDALIVAVTENFVLPGTDFDQDSQPEVIKRLLAIAPERLIVVALRDPYELRYLPDVPAYLCAFSFRPGAAQAAAEVLCGELEPVGRSPVSVPDTDIEANIQTR